MFEKILVPLDGSELAEVSLPYAEELMRRLHSGIVLICVCDVDENDQFREYLHQMAEMIGLRAAKYRQRYPYVEIDDPNIETVILNGCPPEEITDYVHDSQTDLAIMATHGRSGLSRWTMGSVAEKVVRGVNTSICLIRAKGSSAEVKPDCMVSRIFAPLDGSKPGEAALPYIETLASKLNTEVVLFQSVSEEHRPGDDDWVELKKMANRNARIYLRKIESNLIYKGISVRTMVEFGGNPSKQIVQLAERTQAAVVAMSTHGRSGVDRVVFGSVAEKVLRSGTTPLLLVRSPGAETVKEDTYGSRCRLALNT